MANLDLSKISISFDETYHIHNGSPLYNKKFKRVMSFHPPGVAAVYDINEAYHIDIGGNPIYSTRFIKTFGYYKNIAAVCANEGWFHINLQGQPIYPSRYDWVGNFQEKRCVVRKNKCYSHIDISGALVYPQKYLYTGDYKYGIAVAYLTNKMATHIDLDGKEIHGKYFSELGIFHKGFAWAKDSEGYFHIKKDGTPLYDDRYQWCEPFYNEKAFARSKDGRLGLISETGEFEFLKPELPNNRIEM